MQLVGHQDAVGEGASSGLPVGCSTDRGEEVGGDNGILMLAQEGLQILGVPGDAFHLAVGRLDEFGGVAQPLHRLARPMQPLDVVVCLP